MVSLARELKARGHECELFFFTRGPMGEQLPPGLVAHFGDLADCVRLVRERRFDLVHANSGDWHNGVAAVRRTGVRLVLTSHGRVTAGWNSTNCDGYACCSRWEAEEQRAFTDLPVRTILNGVNTERFSPEAGPAAAHRGRPVVAWVGRGPDMVHKRIDRLAAVAPALRRAGVRIWIADPFGPGEVEKVAPEAAAVLRVAAEFWGGVERAALPEFYRRVAASGGCVLSTSAEEGLPLSLIEAQACGCPVVGPDVRGVNEVIDPEHGGVLYPFQMEPKQLASLVLATLADEENMRWRRGASVRHMREKFSLSRMAEDYIRLYEETLSSERRPTAGLRARLWLAPLLNWGDYVERRWSAGVCHYEAAGKLAGQGEWVLARRAARLSVETCPSLYVRPTRLAHLLKILLRPSFLQGGHRMAG